VFIGPFEHHSNELPWRESIADVVVIPQDVEDAKAVLAAATPASGEPIDDLVSADFEHLRWFDLPAACLAGTGVSHTPPGNRDLWH